MDKWEYKVFDWDEQITKSDENSLKNALNEWGSQGWELVNTIIPDENNNIFVFKRPRE